MKICIQTGNVIDRTGYREGYGAFAQAGFEGIDWNLDHAWKASDLKDGSYEGKCIFEKPLEEVIAHYASELETIRENGLEISQAHAPFPCVVWGKPEVTDYAVKVYERNIEYCDYIGCKNLVIHGISRPADKNDESIKEIYERNYDLYSRLIPVLKGTGVTVCLENLFTQYKGMKNQGHCSDPHSACEIIDALNEKAGEEKFGLCLDTGHLNLLRIDIREYAAVLGRRIKCLHVHDNNGSSDQHMAPLTGTVNWGNFCSSLRDAGYDGDLSFETFNQTEIAMDFDPAALMPWLRLIRETGEILRDRITK